MDCAEKLLDCFDEMAVYKDLKNDILHVLHIRNIQMNRSSRAAVAIYGISIKKLDD